MSLAGNPCMCMSMQRRSASLIKINKFSPEGYPTGENSFIYTKEASHLCMDIHMHGFPARFIFFINMLIKQVQTLQDTNMDSRNYII